MPEISQDIYITQITMLRYSITFKKPIGDVPTDAPSWKDKTNVTIEGWAENTEFTL